MQAWLFCVPRHILIDRSEKTPSISQQARRAAVYSGVSAVTTWIDGMTDMLQVILLLATLIWTIVKIAQAIKDFHGD